MENFGSGIIILDPQHCCLFLREKMNCFCMRWRFLTKNSLISKWIQGLCYGSGIRCHFAAWIPIRARIFKCLWRPGIDSKEWISPAFVARAGIFKKSIGLETGKKQGYCTDPPGYIGWRNSFFGIDSWAPKTFKNTRSDLEFLKSLWGLGTE
jgi:hypothetical protein